MKKVFSLEDVMNEPIRIIINYSRSGGTLLTRVLGCLPDVVVLSEVNPHQNHSPFYDVKNQMKTWYGVDIDGDTFIEKVNNTYKWCLDNGKTLIIRDHSAFNFMPNPTNNFSPSGTFQLLEELKDHFKLNVLGFVRDAIDIYISRDCPPLFSAHYYDYATQLNSLNCSIFHYEAFCQSPQTELLRIAQTLNLEVDLTALERYKFYHNVTGDNFSSIPSRGIKANKIVPLKRKRIALSLQKEISSDFKLLEANRLFNYPESYSADSITLAPYPSQAWIELKFRMRKLLGRYPSFEH